MGGSDNDRFSFHRRFLQHLQWASPRPRWVLRSSSHCARLGDLLKTYPDAACVWVHRDPEAALADSVGARVAYKEGLEQRRLPRVEREAIARRLSGIVEGELARALADSLLDRVHHVTLQEILRDPRSVLASVSGTPEGWPVSSAVAAEAARLRPVVLPTGALDLPPLGGRAFRAYRERFQVPDEREDGFPS
ncbi:MAG: sulfotransferase, partial [Acidimicrobiales bacterium]